jgi:hypothetical protein
MGNFQAFKTETDERVEFKDNVISVIANDVTQPPNITNYYQAILKAALTTFKLKAEPTPTRDDSIVSQFENSMKDLWKEDCNFDNCLIGYILKDTHLSKDIDTLLARIADEENKYYWKWLEGGNEVIDSADNQTILNRLRIVNANLLNKIFVRFVNDTGSKLGGEHWIKNEKPLQDQTLIVPAIAISPENSYTNGTDLYYGVYVNPNARLLFLDNSEDTQKYKYGKKDGSIYEIKLTYIYNDNDTKNITVGDTTEESKAEYFLGVGHEQYRYLKELKAQINKLATKEKSNVTSTTKKVFAVKKEESLLKNDQNKNRIHFKLPSNEDDTKRNDDETKRVKELAHQAACELPKGNYHCFYHDNGGTLMGHISAVNIGEGGRGSSGYPMRADKVNEVNYRWLIDLPNGNPNFPLAKLWSYLFELNPDFLVTLANPPAIQKNRTTNTPDAFYPTNWPYDKGAEFTHPVTGINSFIQYYKTFNPSATKRNNPSQNPFPPRITNPNIAGYDYKFEIKTIEISVKLDNTGYRVWKKFNASGQDLTLGFNENERVDAGKTMAEALSDFHVYPSMKASGITPKITDSKLSATSFAKYVVGQLNDEAVKVQWRKDNKLNADAVVNASSLRTDQEWCHLFGHGDGGPEELGNFVSGSKHCNTEQLAIETGQRRVSQNDDFKTEQSKLKARITAYLIPNVGTWVTGRTYTQDELNKTLLTSITDVTVKDKQSEFFEKVPDVSPDQHRLKLKKDGSDQIDEDALRTAFKALSDEISNPASDANKKKQLFQFRHNLEIKFFMYLPIARWMRYKLYYDGLKVFDHIYDAQSESINLHECQILDYMVERALYIAMGKEAEYKQKIKSRVEKLMPSAEEAGIIDTVLELDKKLYEIFNSLNLIDSFAQQIVTEIFAIKTILGKPVPDFKGIKLDQLETNYNQLEARLTTANTDIQSQRDIYTKIVEDFNKMTVEQRNQSQLKLIITDTGLGGKIQYLKTKVEEMQTTQKTIATKIENMKTELAKSNPDKNAMEVDEIEEQAKVVKRQREEIKKEQVILDVPRPLKRARSMYLNNQKL